MCGTAIDLPSMHYSLQMSCVASIASKLEETGFTDQS